MMEVKPEPLTGSQNGPGIPAPPVEPSLIGLTAGEITRVLLAMGEPAYRGRQVALWIYARGVLDFAAMTNLPLPLRERLQAEHAIGVLRETARRETPDRRTRKLGFTIPGGGVIESVYMT